MRKTVKMGVLGVGRMGLAHCRLIEAVAGLELVAASSGVAALVEAAAEAFDIPTYSDHADLLADSEVEWVVIATTTDRHAEWARRAIAMGKHCIVEKPVALTLEEAEAIFALAREKSVRVTVYNSRRWDRDFRLVRKLMQAGALGHVYRMESRVTDCSAGWGGWGAQGSDNPWRLKKAFGGGMLNDWGPHLFDQILQLTASPVQTVYGKLYSEIWSREVDDHFWAELVFADGTAARIEAGNTFRVPQPRWCLLGHEATLNVVGGAPAQWHTAVVRHTAGEFPAETRYDITQGELNTGFYEDFARTLAAGGALTIAPEQVQRVMGLIEAVRQSNRTAQIVQMS